MPGAGLVHPLALPSIHLQLSARFQLELVEAVFEEDNVNI